MQSFFNKQRQTWVYRESYIDPLTGKRKLTSVSLHAHSRAAQRQASELLQEKIRQLTQAREPDEMTLGQLYKDYIEYQKHTVKASTWSRNITAIRPVVDAIGTDALCSRLTAAVLQGALTGEATTVNHRLDVVKTMIRWGYRHDYMPDIRWLDKVDRLPDKSERQKVADKYLEAGDLQRLIEGMGKYRWRLLTQFLALTGLRLGEAVALEDADVGTVIRVTKTYDAKNHIVTSPKSFDSYRDVYVQKELRPVIAQIRRWRLLNVPGSEKFFPGYGDKYLSHFSYEKYFRSATEQILGRRLTPHCLRHTHASLCFEQGMTIEAVSARLGHSNSRITKEIYTHITERKRDEYNKQMDAITML